MYPIRFKGLFTLLIACQLAACGTTALSSRMKFSGSQTDPTSPPSGGFAFALRRTDLVMAPAAPQGTQQPPTVTPPKPADKEDKKTKDPKKVTEATSIEGTGKSADQHASGQPADGATPSGRQYSDACVGAKVWGDCLKSLSATPTPSSSALKVYVVQPDPASGTKTTITPKVSDSDPLFLTSVSFNTTSTAPNTIANIGAGVTTGMAWGPWGALVGGIIGIFGGNQTANQAQGALLTPPSWTDLTCTDDIARNLVENPSKTPKLTVPVSLSYVSATSDQHTCWNSVPTVLAGKFVTSDDLPYEISGWFYRFIAISELPKNASNFPPVLREGSLPANFLPSEEYFAEVAATKWTATKQTFPATACRAVELQVTWWQELESEKAGNKMHYSTYKAIVADPKWVQVVTAPNQGSVTVLPLCGAYASAGAPSTPVGDSISALLKQVQAVRSGQSSSTKKKQ
jgi:hypothetical protein